MKEVISNNKSFKALMSNVKLNKEREDLHE